MIRERRTPMRSRTKQLATTALGALTLGAVGATWPAPVVGAAPPAATSAFHQIASRRVLDTRTAPGARLGAGATIDVTLPEAKGATAVVLSVTVTGPQAPGFVTLYARGAGRPNVSTLNYVAGSIISNQATVAVDGDGGFTIFTLSATHVVVDLIGAYDPADTATDGRFIPQAPHRVLDTRTTTSAVPPNGSVSVASGLTGAEAAVITLTVTETAGPGFVTAYEPGADPTATSTLNFESPVTTRAILATVPLAADGTFAVYASVATHVVVDIVGGFTAASAPPGRAGLFVPVVAIRQFDTRQSGAYRLAAGSAINVRYAEEPLALLGNLTLTDGRRPSFATAAPGAGASLANSSVNSDRAGQSIASAVAVAYQPGVGSSFTNLAAGHEIFDLSGFYVTETGSVGAGVAAPSAVIDGVREQRAPFSDISYAALRAQFPDATTTRAAVMSSDGVIHSFGQQDTALPAASTSKVLILGCVYAQAQDAGRSALDYNTAATAQKMISLSDNAAALDLLATIGGLDGLQRCGYRFGATSVTTNPGGSGATQIAPEDFVVIVRNVLRYESTVLHGNFVGQARQVMLSWNIKASDRWGIGAGHPAGSSWWIKNGWYTTSPDDFRHPSNRINSVGMIETADDWWIIAVQGDQYASLQGGVIVTERIAGAVNASMARPLG